MQRRTLWKRHYEYALIAMLALIPLAMEKASAQSFSLQKLLMPDALGASHAELENNCGNCHLGFNKEAQSNLCLNCHEEIQQDIETQQGFHASIPSNNPINCNQCHTDHRGRNTSLTTLSPTAFNHDDSNFPLLGKHTELSCNACHSNSDNEPTTESKRKRDVESSCVSCHRQDDIHNQQLGESCADCHNPNSWKESEFDHAKTKFSLEGKHEKVSCAACHADQHFKNTPQQCNSCHLLDDIHQGQQGKQCQDCHQPISWSDIKFDHNTQTDFKLLGAHSVAACAGCHKSSQFESINNTDCVDCHLKDDIHLKKRGSDCEQCHTVTGWQKTTFNHDQDTEFALTGRHQSLRCASCHQGSIADESTSKECITCHQSDDIHQGEQGETCNRCHNENGWGNTVIFDHDITRFPLIGLHAVAACEQCHITTPFKKVDIHCIDCHVADDIHQKSLGVSCHNCHSPNSWDVWYFEHDRDTKFSLDGEHSNLECSACHTEPTNDRVRANRNCISCHANDDKHQGEFGKYCDKCHKPIGFDQIKRL